MCPLNLIGKSKQPNNQNIGDKMVINKMKIWIGWKSLYMGFNGIKIVKIIYLMSNVPLKPTVKILIVLLRKYS